MPAPRHALCVGTIVVRDGNILLVRQAPGTGLAGKWSIPWGFIDEGEAPAVAARRETLEEAGVTIAVRGLAGAQVLPGKLGGVGLVFIGDYIAGEPQPDNIETDRATFANGQELADLPVEPWCRWLARLALDGDLRCLGEAASNPYELPGYFNAL